MIDNMSKLILGTAQFGLKYGITNYIGKPSKNQVFAILDTAGEQDIEYLDTADAYGNSIELIGHFHKQQKYHFKILSKFRVTKAGELMEQAKISLNKLLIPCYHVYSYHSFADYNNHQYLKDELQLLKNNGLIKKIGISVYTNLELEKVITDEIIDVIQFPYNLLDNQNIRGLNIRTAKCYQKEIHVRSVFLQGLIFMDEGSIPVKLMPIKRYIKEIREYCFKNSITMESLALSYAFFNKNIDNVLIGVDTKDQLLRNLESITNLKDAFDYINQNINIKETDLLNPINW